MLNNVVTVKQVQTPTEVDHYQIQRVVDIYVTPSGEDLGRVTSAIRKLISKTEIPGERACESARHGRSAWKLRSRALPSDS